MQKLVAGCVVRSIAGHDKDSFYVVVEVLGQRVRIADGKARKLGKPKAKNTLHVRPTTLVLDMQEVKTDKKLRETLKAFAQAAEEEEGN
jgi:ribosomal protein L14E/L6E/L27E